MNASELKKRKATNLLFLLLALAGAGGFLAYKLFFGPKGDAWAGTWEVTYFYDNEPGLIYSGTLEISRKDSLTAILEIVPPQGSRSETPEVTGLVLSAEAGALKATIVHRQYRLRGGYLTESVELRLDDRATLSGTGKCLEYCAEGTEQAIMIWHGTKSVSI